MDQAVLDSSAFVGLFIVGGLLAYALWRFFTDFL